MSDAGAATATIPRAADAARRRRAFGRLATRNRLAVVAALALLAAVLGALLAPWLPLADPDVVDTPNRLRPPLSAGYHPSTSLLWRHPLPPLWSGARRPPAAGADSAAGALPFGAVLLGLRG